MSELVGMLDALGADVETVAASDVDDRLGHP